MGLICSLGCSARALERGPFTDARALSCRLRGAGDGEEDPLGECTLRVVLFEVAVGEAVVAYGVRDDERDWDADMD